MVTQARERAEQISQDSVADAKAREEAMSLRADSTRSPSRWPAPLPPPVLSQVESWQ